MPCQPRRSLLHVTVTSRCDVAAIGVDGDAAAARRVGKTACSHRGYAEGNGTWLVHSWWVG